MNVRQSSSSDEGFTVIESVIALVIAVMFIITASSLFIAVTRAISSDRNRADASSLAYSNLRRYAYVGANPTWFACSFTTSIQANPNAEGQYLDGGPLSDAQTDLPQPVTFELRAWAPFGCILNSNKGKPILVRSTVTYGPNNLSVDHAALVEFNK